MSFEADLYHFLTNDPGISAELGSRVYPVAAPPVRPSYPYLIYYLISDPSIRHMTGASAFALLTIQFDVTGDDFLAVVDAAESLRNALDGMSDVTIGSGGATKIRTATKKSARDDKSRLGDSSGTWIYTRQMDFEFAYARSAPTGPS